jgi:hypothetical protein
MTDDELQAILDFDPWAWRQWFADTDARWSLTSNWETGNHLSLPAGTKLLGEMNLSNQLINNTVKASDGNAVPLPLPVDAMCLTQAAADLMVAWHSMERVHRMRAAEGVTFRNPPAPAYQPTPEERAGWEAFQAERAKRGKRQF